MSRSYKKSSYVTDNTKKGRKSGRSYMKRYVNRSLRNKLKSNDELLKGSFHKKYFNSYDICDYKYYWSKSDAIRDYYNFYSSYEYFRKRYPTLEDYLKQHRKSVIDK